MAPIIVPTEILYESPPGSGGNDGALPGVYDPVWQRFTNLTPEQITAFQGFPQDLAKYIGVIRWQWEINGTSADGPQTPYITIPLNVPTIGGMQLYTDDRSQSKVSQLKQAIDAGVITSFPFPLLAVNGIYLLQAADCTAMYGYVVRWVQQTYDIAATLVGGAFANPQTVTTRAQVVTAFQAMTVK